MTLLVPMGSSLTRYVEPVLRDSTSVCTLTLPYAVRRAFGIAAASSCSSSGVGFSRTERAAGRTNSRVAKDRSFRRDWSEQAIRKRTVVRTEHEHAYQVTQRARR